LNPESGGTKYNYQIIRIIIANAFAEWMGYPLENFLEA
jgi:hypothetical protein